MPMRLTCVHARACEHFSCNFILFYFASGHDSPVVDDLTPDQCG